MCNRTQFNGREFDPQWSIPGEKVPRTRNEKRKNHVACQYRCSNDADACICLQFSKSAARWYIDFGRNATCAQLNVSAPACILGHWPLTSGHTSRFDTVASCFWNPRWHNRAVLIERSRETGREAPDFRVYPCFGWENCTFADHSRLVNLGATKWPTEWLGLSDKDQSYMLSRWDSQD